ncbi:MAG: pyrroline-5-carboxylate reductase [Pseudomonadota bacterium]
MTSASSDALLGFVGGGNMASSLIGGLVKGGHAAERIGVVDPSEAQRDALARDFGVQVADSAEAVAGAAAVVIAVKPHIVEAACRGLAPTLTSDTLVISVAAGTLSDHIALWLGGHDRVVRCMPNTPALYGVGASVLHASTHVSEAQRTLAQYILAAAGAVWWVDEEPQLDAVTALSGSGPAYGFLLIEAMTDAGHGLGLPRELAEQLAVQTLLGSATMAQQDDRGPAALREGVTSKGGTTAAALNTFERGQFRALVASAMTAARDRARELAQPTGETS